MLHLHTGIHLNEVELPVFIEELKRTRTTVADLLAGSHAALAHLFHQTAWNARRRRLFNHLLVATLHGAVTLAQIHAVLVLVTQHLNFDVTGVLEELLHIHRGIAECDASFCLGHLHGVDQCSLGVHHAHATTTAAACGLDDHRVANGLGNALDLCRIVRQFAVGTGHAGHASLDHGLLGRHLVTHDADGLGSRANELEAALFHTLGKVCVFRQEAVAGVDGLCICDFCRRDDGRHVQIAQRRWCWANTYGLIGQLDVLGITVCLGVDHHGLDAHLAASALDAQGDFTPIGNQNFLKHGGPRCSPPHLGRIVHLSCRGRSATGMGRYHSITNSGWPYSTAWPFSARIRVTVPDLSASISFKIFMASIMHSVSPSLTWSPTSMKGLAPGLEAR